ncbi:MAG: hypothetical protein JSU57_05415 [Candidatus Heimdallarchaeota archaeon]|nr:MAG: hypothetical protein JSU57_05415 [Candidatus Heimdallarchaeota archaeon]
MMFHKDLASKDSEKQREVKQLKEFLKLTNGSSEHDLIATWRFIKHMQSELELPSQTPIEELVKLYNNFEEIRKVFNYQINNFTQLNELYHEINAVRDKLNILKSCSVTEVLSQINFELIPSLGFEDNSLLKRLLLLYLSPQF